MEVSEHQDRFDALGVRLVALTYDEAETSRRFARQSGIRYPILADPDSRIIREFGILNTDMAPGSRYYGVPYPGIFIVAPDGRVFAKLAEEDYRKRPAVELILRSVQEMAADTSAGSDAN